MISNKLFGKKWFSALEMLNVNNGDNWRSILKKVALLVFIRKKSQTNEDRVVTAVTLFKININVNIIVGFIWHIYILQLQWILYLNFDWETLAVIN